MLPYQQQPRVGWILISECALIKIQNNYVHTKRKHTPTGCLLFWQTKKWFNTGTRILNVSFSC